MPADLLTPAVLIPWLAAMAFGVFVGATPGLTATMAVALIVPISFHLADANAGLAMIIGVSFTAIFAGDIPATYLRIPGTPASAAATLDGHELAKQGRGGFALMLDLLCSCLGGLIGVGLLVLVASPLASFALLFSDFEYFWLGVLGLSMSAFVTQGSTARGLIAAMLGVLIGTVGMDVVTGSPRYPLLEELGSVELMRGFDFIPVMIGLFGIAEVLRNIGTDVSWSASSVEASATPVKETLLAMWKHKFTMLISAVCGTFIGALPGAGADVAAWGAYGLAKKTSRDPDKFGRGAIEGVIAPTSANNAAVAGAWIPALVFGVPGDAVTAIVLGAMLMYDITPGPELFKGDMTQVRGIFWIALLTQFLLLPAGFFGIKVFGLLLRLPRRFVLTGVVVFSVVGAYALNNSLFDVYVMLAFGLIGYFLESHRIPLAPLILGLILGPLVERKLRTGLISSGGDFTPMFTRPICIGLIAMLVVLLAGGPLLRMLQPKRTDA
ncbi:MAG: tripartite tricarboxylate transporter permease [Planctomycetota bacterium]|nr:tripartite tricarboxylate transporter permease [Planctomycetota bacterium]